jgi:hypothetical protein
MREKEKGVANLCQDASPALLCFQAQVDKGSGIGA